MADTDKALIASSDFDPTQFAQGMDVMVSSLDKVIAKEDELNKKLGEGQKALNVTNVALKQTNDQIAALDKTSASYQQQLQKLTQQQQQLQKDQTSQNATMKAQRDQLAEAQTSADKYKTALAGVSQVAQQVKASGGDIFNLANLTTQLQQVNQVAGEFRNIFQGKVDTQELDDLEQRLAGTTDEFEKLRDVIAFVQEKLSTLDPNTQEFKDLTTVVQTGNEVLAQFDKVSGDVAAKEQTVKARLRELTAELAAMQEAGQEGTDQFQDMEREAGELRNALDKTGERVRNFANETRGIEVAVEALRGVAAGFELAEGASALFGVKNEAVEEAIKRLNAIMAIANGLQEVSNLLKKESTLRLGVEEAATKAFAISQRVLAATFGTTAAASRGLATALAATGIGALIVGIGLLVAALSTLSEKTEEQVEAQKRLNEENEIGIDFNQRYLAGIESNEKLFETEAQVRQATNEKIRQSDVAKLRSQIANNDELRKIQTKSLEEQLAQAKEEEEKEREGYERAATLRRNAVTNNNKVLFQLRTALGREPTEQELVNANAEKVLPELDKTIAQFEKVTQKRIDIEKAIDLKLLTNQRDAAKERIELRRAELAQYEDFLKRLEELRQKLLLAQDKQNRQDAAQLEKTSQDQLNAELRNVSRDVRLGKLTSDQGTVLKGLLKQINGVELETELREFTKKSIAAQQNIEDQILTLRLQSGETRANLLRDQLDKEAALLSLESHREFAKLEVDRTAQLQGVRDAFDQGLISEGQFQRNTDRIKRIYDDLFNDLAATTARKAEELARTAFTLGKGLLEQLFADSGAKLSEQTTAEVNALTQQFVTGKIQYERYQRELTAILLRESRKRIDQQLAEANEALAATQRRLAAEQDPAQRKTLQDEIIALREQIAQLKRQADAGEAAGTKATDDEFKRKVGVVASYAQAIGNVVEQVVKFWELANQAEQKQLDRSIALQERRVDYATKIAERGNATYLRLEEDRLQQLQLKQENAARKQLAINAVLQASQALVAFTTALAQGISTGGPLGGLAIAAAVLGAIASGYAIVQSLQEAQNSATTKLYGGTKSVERGPGIPSGRDTVPAMLTEGEYVAPVDVANDYRPTLDAIYDRAIDPAALNAFVRDTSVGRRTLATLDHDRVAEATDVHSSYDARLVLATQVQTAKLQEANERLGEMQQTLEQMGFSVHLDKKGLAVAVAGSLNKMAINKKL